MFGTVVVLVEALALLLRGVHPALSLAERTDVSNARPRHLLVARQTQLLAEGLLLLSEQIPLSGLDRLPKIREHLARINLAPPLPLHLLSVNLLEYLLLLVGVLRRLRAPLQRELPRLQRKLILARLLYPDAPVRLVFEHLFLQKSVKVSVAGHFLIPVHVLHILLIQ